jgi:NAD(P)-dependent dehydrogenase (short-subunit alcohol dehydrogenase family)
VSRGAPQRLAGRRIIVSGAASGIGRATATLLAAEGAHVLAGDIDVPAVEEAARAIGAEPHRLDVTDAHSWTTIVAAAGDGLHGLVTCAGVDAPDDTLGACTPADWDRVMRINLDGTFLGVQAAARALREAGRGGSIVTIASVLAVVADGATVSYGASKAAVAGLTRSAALALAPDGIRVNTILPGYIRTPMTERWLDGLAGTDAERELVALHPLGRLGEPHEIAGLALHLLGDDATYVTGAELAIDGGYLAV